MASNFNSPLSGVPLTQSTSSAIDITKCIICQRRNKDEKVTTSEGGRTNVINAAEIRQDEVLKRLRSIIDPLVDFVYHCNNACYKNYTLKKSLLKLQREKSEAINNGDEEVTVNEPHLKKLRSDTIPRSDSVCPKNISYDVACVVCGHKKHAGVREKYRICESKRALIFLEAAMYFQDEVYTRTCDLEDESSVFGADVYYHKICLESYLVQFRRSSQESKITPKISTKEIMMEEVSHVIKQMLDDGYGVTLSEIRDYLNTKETGILIRNSEVKHFLLKFFGTTIKFSTPTQNNKSLIVYSSKLTTEEMTEKVRSLNVLKDAGRLVRNALKNTDFNLDQKIGDAQELKNSWNSTLIPQTVIDFLSEVLQVGRLSLMSKSRENGEILFDITDDGELDSDTNDENEEGLLKESSLFCRIMSIVQILYYNIHRGKKKTPMHLMTGHTVHEKCKSKSLITSLNKLGVSASYNQIMQARAKLAQYTIKSCSSGISLPSHFVPHHFTTGAMDNFDHEEATLTGLQGSHDTVMVLYQEKPKEVPEKKYSPEIVEMKFTKRVTSQLPCQSLRHFHKQSSPLMLPHHLRVSEDMLDANASEVAVKESVISMMKALHTHGGGDNTVTWGSVNAVISQSVPPLQQVGFLPILPYPITAYDSVYSAMKNFQSLLNHLHQSALPVACDEGVYHIAAEIQITSNEFPDIVLMMGSFHMTKVLLACIGKYLSGSGLENTLIENSVFGSKVVESVLKGSNYIRSLKGIFMLAEVVERLKWKMFLKDNINAPSQLATDTLEAIKEKNVERANCLFQELSNNSTILLQEMNDFSQLNMERSEMCRYLEGFLSLVLLLKNLIRADREGNWQLHLKTVQQLLPVFHVFDRINYLRWASLYLEQMRNLETQQPQVFENFMNGLFVFRRTKGKFNAVGLDMALEQTINRSQKSQGGIIGQTKRKDYVVEWQLIYHDILEIRNAFRTLINVAVVDYDLQIHHELVGKHSEELEASIKRMCSYIEARGNPYDTHSEIKLQNFTTHELVPRENAEKMLSFAEKGNELYLSFRNERFVSKSKPLSATIHKAKLPSFRTDNSHCMKHANKKQNSEAKNLARAQRLVDVAKERGMHMNEILTHDVLPMTSLLDNKGATMKPHKSDLMTTLVKKLDGDCHHTLNKELSTCLTVDVMSQIRKIPVKEFKTFGDLFAALIENMQSIHKEKNRTDYVFDSYLKTSIKNAERERRSTIEPITMTNISASTQLPVQMDRFWASAENKSMLQRALREYISDRALSQQGNTILSSEMCDNEAPLAVLSIKSGKCTEVMDENLMKLIEEADLRIIPHIMHALKEGYQQVIVASNDTDVLVLLLHFVKFFRENGLHALWLRKSSKECIPLHVLAQKLGSLCDVILSVHFLTGSDVTSKVGTKYSALKANPINFLLNFGRHIPADSDSFRLAENYLIQVLKLGSTSTTFDQLRLELLRHSNTASLLSLPPTSCSLNGHLKRSFFMVYTCASVLNSSASLSPENYGWSVDEEGTVLPDPCMNCIPERVLVTCACKKKCGRRCRCISNFVCCIDFCKCTELCENGEESDL